MKKLLAICLFWLSVYCDSCLQAKTYTYFPELFPQDPIGTEYNSYQLLEEQPIEDINYLAVPWTILMKNNTLHQLPCKPKIENGFTICQHFKFELILPLLRDMGITVLFTPHVEIGKTYEGITVLPYPHNAINAAPPARHKDLLYSFIGTDAQQKVRKNIFKLPKKKDVVIVKRKSWGAYSTTKRENIEYRNVLARSRYALCPRGFGASTIRFWEALKSGAVPVILADAFQLPSEFDWTECTIRIAEKDYHLLDAIIRSIPIEQEEKMRANCLLAYELYSGKNLVSTIRHFFNERDIDIELSF